MKKFLLIFATSLIAFTSGCSQGESESKEERAQVEQLEKKEKIKEEEKYKNFDFRNFCFGMTEEEVKEHEKDVSFEKTIEDADADYLFGSTNICNTNGSITYKFVDDKLKTVAFISGESYVNATLYYDEYMVLKKSIIDKYGSPIVEKENKRGDLYSDNIGDALKYEEVDFVDIWELPQGDIILKCYSRNYEPIVTIGFTIKDASNENKSNGL